jgi:dsDNA-specific endonuclease/ATPase MutS2
MEPGVEIYQPSRLYGRMGWAAVAGSAVCVLCGLRAPLALIPASLCIATAVALFWLAARPPIRLEHSQFSIGERAIAWREVREINSSRFVSPLILNLKLTNARHKLLVYPGDPDRINSLLVQLRKNSHLATFDGVAHRDYWTWSTLINRTNEPPAVEHPVRMLSAEEEEEIERLYQKLKSVGRLDSRSTDSSNTSPED